MGADNQALWISWYPHRRTTGLCEAWSVPLVIVRSEWKGLGKWLQQGWRTLAVLKCRRPALLFVQNPSLGLTVLALAVRPVFGFSLVVDAHNEGVRPFVRPSSIVKRLTRLLLKKSDFTIVTNEALAEDVRQAGGTPRILPDRLPRLPDELDVAAVPHDPSLVVVVSTFAPDEPLAEIIEAARCMPETNFAVSGNPGKVTGRSLSLPPNIRLTGFLPEKEYWSILASAAVILDLTLMPDCLVCGAYEGLALGRPLVLSDNDAGRAIFGPAAVFCEPNPESIVSAIRAALLSQSVIAVHAKAHREHFRIKWEARAEGLIREFRESSSRGHKFPGSR